MAYSAYGSSAVSYSEINHYADALDDETSLGDDEEDGVNWFEKRREDDHDSEDGDVPFPLHILFSWACFLTIL